jgi:hypothetical protein
MTSELSETGAMMGICVGQLCIGAAVAGHAWNGTWRHAQTQHYDAFPADAGHVQRAERGLRVASEVAQWARSRGVTRAWLEAAEPDAEGITQAELSALVAAELIRADVDVVAVALDAAGAASAPNEIRARLLEQDAPEGLCLVQYVALAMLAAARHYRATKAEQLRTARESMPLGIAQILTGIAR